MAVDYTSFPLAYRLKKVIRYVRMYGPMRTLEKVRGQYHMKLTGGTLSSNWYNSGVNSDSEHDVAIIGCGNFAYSNIAYYCSSLRPGSIRCAYDPNGSRAISLVRRYGGCYAAASAIDAIRDPLVRTVFIASNHATHAEYAIDAIEAGKIVHIEKPHVVNERQLVRLYESLCKNPKARVFLGFNRPRSEHFKRIQSILSAESGPLMINWFIAGHQLDEDHWYFSDAEGGRVLGNLCHWTDLSLRLVGLDRAFPVEVSGMNPSGSKSDFAITMSFGDGSIGVISFSAKGHTFEGVREYLNIHKGNALVSMRDFHTTTFDVGESKSTYAPLFRDHGHRAAIQASLGGDNPEANELILGSGRLFLAVKEAIESGKRILLESADSQFDFGPH